MFQNHTGNIYKTWISHMSHANSTCNVVCPYTWKLHFTLFFSKDKTKSRTRKQAAAVKAQHSLKECMSSCLSVLKSTLNKIGRQKRRMQTKGRTKTDLNCHEMNLQTSVVFSVVTQSGVKRQVKRPFSFNLKSKCELGYNGWKFD